jgi:hypothetical protein
MRCVAVTTTHTADKLAQADVVAATLADLPPETMARLLGD